MAMILLAVLNPLAALLACYSSPHRCRCAALQESQRRQWGPTKLRLQGLRARQPKAGQYAPCGDQEAALGHRWAHQATCELRNQSEGAQAYRRGHWLDQDRRRTGKDQAQGSGQADQASADVLCGRRESKMGALS